MAEQNVSPDLSGLGVTDLARIPEPIQKMSDREVYTKLREWYQKNVSLYDNYDHGDKADLNTRELITALPSPEDASDIEIAVIFQEIGVGNLEWARSQEIGDELKVQDYYYGRTTRGLEDLNPEEVQVIEKSPIRPFLFDKNSS